MILKSTGKRTTAGMSYRKRGTRESMGMEAYRLRSKFGLRWGQISKKLEYKRCHQAFEDARYWAECNNEVWPPKHVTICEQMYLDRLDGDSWDDLCETFNIPERWKIRHKVREYCKNHNLEFPD